MEFSGLFLTIQELLEPMRHVNSPKKTGGILQPRQL
jgi:hypothetical protein